MAIAYDATASGSTVFGTSATWSHTCTGSDRVLYVAASAGVAITGITYNGVALTILAGSGTGAVLARLVAPATGANNVVVSTGSSEEISGVSASYTGVDQTTPDANTTSATTGDENPTINVTSATGKLVVGMSSYASNATQSQTPGTGVTERNERDEGFHNVAIGDKAGETTTTFAYTRATGAFYAQLIAATSVNEAGGGAPTIDTQPTAQKVVRTNDTRTSATFTVAATTSGGSLTYDWELETSVGGGAYANLADGNGGTWTGQTAATAVGTFTANTLSGRRVRCNVTDDNGTTTTNAVTLTIYTGPVASASSGTTNGSGVAAPTVTSDDPMDTVTGAFVRATWVVDGVTKYQAIRPATP